MKRNYNPAAEYVCNSQRGVSKANDQILFDGKNINSTLTGETHIKPDTRNNNGGILTFTMTDRNPVEIAYLVEELKVILPLDEYEGEVEIDTGRMPIPSDFPGFVALSNLKIEFVKQIPNSEEALMTIPGIGRITARKIIAERERLVGDLEDDEEEQPIMVELPDHLKPKLVTDTPTADESDGEE